MVIDFLRRMRPSLSGSLLSKNIAPAVKIEAESSETTVSIYRWHGVISENNGISNLAYEPSHCTDFCSLCYLPPRFQAALFPASHPYKTPGKPVVVCRHSNVSFSEWETRRGCELSCNMLEFNFLKPTGSWCTNMFNIQKLYILPTLYLFGLSLRTSSDFCRTWQTDWLL